MRPTPPHARPLPAREYGYGAYNLGAAPGDSRRTAGRPEAPAGAAYDSAFLEAAGLITAGGLSAGVITPEVDPAAKVAMGFLMIFGRLEIVAILYVFLPRPSP